MRERGGGGEGERGRRRRGREGEMERGGGRAGEGRDQIRRANVSENSRGRGKIVSPYLLVDQRTMHFSTCG